MAFVTIQHPVSVVVKLLIGTTLRVGLLVGWGPGHWSTVSTTPSPSVSAVPTAMAYRAMTSCITDVGWALSKDMLVNVCSDAAAAVANGKWQERGSPRTGCVLNIGQAEGFLVGRDITKNGPCINGVDGDAEFSLKTDDDVGKLVVVINDLVSYRCLLGG